MMQTLRGASTVAYHRLGILYYFHTVRSKQEEVSDSTTMIPMIFPILPFGEILLGVGLSGNRDFS